MTNENINMDTEQAAKEVRRHWYVNYCSPIDIKTFELDLLPSETDEALIFLGLALGPHSGWFQYFRVMNGVSCKAAEWLSHGLMIKISGNGKGRLGTCPGSILTKRGEQTLRAIWERIEPEALQGKSLPHDRQDNQDEKQPNKTRTEAQW